ncbi:AEC family transporter [Amaricoccus sp.]|uniref:AEC family transporter n=1 Tax=Amaricoccus sp. TaxID=1872485 RepID=UPI001B480CD2|nr:AEC family transporter [Amaricoccus sp.]MBP7000376.1 AEC family transporter [Amaricoccus sp.]
MPETLSLTGTIFVLIGVGYLAVRGGLLGPGAAGALGGYVANLALPALIFAALTTRPLGEVVDAGYLLAYGAGSLAVLGLGYGWSRASGYTAVASTFRAMGMSCANSGFIGYPVLMMALPAVAAPALALNMIVENLLLIPLVLALAEAARGGAGGGAGPILRRLSRNPIILALVAGVAVSAAGVALPGLVARSVGLLAQSSAAAALVAIGASLAALPAEGAAGGRGLAGIAPVALGKLVLHPLAVLAGLGIAGRMGLAVAPDLAKAVVIMAATPAMGIYPILAGQYGEGRPAALAMLAMTVCAFATLNALLVILGP